MNRLFGLRQTGEFVAAGQRFAQPFAQDLPACTSEYLLKGGIHIKKLEIGTGRSAGDPLAQIDHRHIVDQLPVLREQLELAVLLPPPLHEPAQPHHDRRYQQQKQRSQNDQVKFVFLEKARRNLRIYGVFRKQGRIDPLVYEVVIVEVSRRSAAVSPRDVAGRLSFENFPDNGAGHPTELDRRNVISAREATLLVIPVGQRKNRRVGQPEDHPLHVIVQVFMPVLGNEPGVVDNPFFIVETRKRIEQLSGRQFRRAERFERQIREIFLYRLPHLFPDAEADVAMIRNQGHGIHSGLQLPHHLDRFPDKRGLFEDGQVISFGNLRSRHRRTAVEVSAEQILDRSRHRIARIADHRRHLLPLPVEQGTANEPAGIADIDDRPGRNGIFGEQHLPFGSGVLGRLHHRDEQLLGIDAHPLLSDLLHQRPVQDIRPCFAERSGIQQQNVIAVIGSLSINRWKPTDEKK